MDPQSLKAVLSQAQAFFASKGLRFTKQRAALTTLIFRNHDHFRPEELLAKLRKSDGSVSRATIYRTISLLVESGMLREISLGGGSVSMTLTFCKVRIIIISFALIAGRSWNLRIPTSISCKTASRGGWDFPPRKRRSGSREAAIC